MGLAQTVSAVVVGLIVRAREHDMIRHKDYGWSQMFLWGMSPSLLLKLCRDTGLVYARMFGFEIQKESAIDVRFRCETGFILDATDLVYIAWPCKPI